MSEQTDNSSDPADRAPGELRQRVLVLYLRSSALDSEVIGWSLFSGRESGEESDEEPFASGPGAQDEPPYKTGVHALRDGWRLIQASTLRAAPAGQELQTDYLKYEFFFEQLVQKTR